MIKRGEILRDASAGPGLLSVDGEHYQFSPRGMWRSPTPPVPGMQVQIEFAPDCSITSITAVSDLPVAQPENHGAPMLEKQSQTLSGFRPGPATFISFTLLAIAWFFLPAISVQTLFGKIDFTFWQLLGFLNSETTWDMVLQGRRPPSAGLYGLLALATLCGPLLYYVWNGNRRYLTNLLPLLFMVFVAFMVRSSLHSSVLEVSDGPLAEVQRQAQEEISKAISVSFGTYLAFLLSSLLSASAVFRFLCQRGVDTEAPLGRQSLAG